MPTERSATKARDNLAAMEYDIALWESTIRTWDGIGNAPDDIVEIVAEARTNLSNARIMWKGAYDAALDEAIAELTYTFAQESLARLGRAS